MRTNGYNVRVVSERHPLEAWSEFAFGSADLVHRYAREVSWDGVIEDLTAVIDYHRDFHNLSNKGEVWFISSIAAGLNETFQSVARYAPGDYKAQISVGIAIAEAYSKAPRWHAEMELPTLRIHGDEARPPVERMIPLAAGAILRGIELCFRSRKLTETEKLDLPEELVRRFHPGETKPALKMLSDV